MSITLKTTTTLNKHTNKTGRVHSHGGRSPSMVPPLKSKYTLQTTRYYIRENAKILKAFCPCPNKKVFTNRKRRREFLGTLDNTVMVGATDALSYSTSVELVSRTLISFTFNSYQRFSWYWESRSKYSFCYLDSSFLEMRKAPPIRKLDYNHLFIEWTKFPFVWVSGFVVRLGGWFIYRKLFYKIL